MPPAEHRTLKERLMFLKDPKFLKVLLLGQFLSLCITGTNVTTTLLAANAMPTTQTFFNYLIVAVVYNTVAIYKRGFKGWLYQFRRRALFYFILAFIDVEGNYFVVKAFQYTSLLSAMLLDAWTTPVVMILSFFCLRARFRWLQYLGVFIALCGLALLVVSDVLTGKNYGAVDAVKGDLFCILGATLYGFSNVGEEFMIRKHPHYEVVGMLSFFATFINFVQLMILERKEFAEFSKDSFSIGMMVVYTVCMFCIYSLGPIMFRMAGAVVFNLSLLTSDFYGLIFGLGLFGYTVTWLYPVAYVIVIVGIAAYHFFPVPEPGIGGFDKERQEQERRELFGIRSETDIESQPTDASADEVLTTSDEKN
ncbi:solute carrier family 35 member SLC35F1/F2/F6 [Umbelopsis sp. AD052]|nr:solute carrier family 35 member SLC35F1/F2/F6 [Umbelopsis sp. AD052]